MVNVIFATQCFSGNFKIITPEMSPELCGPYNSTYVTSATSNTLHLDS